MRLRYGWKFVSLPIEGKEHIGFYKHEITGVRVYRNGDIYIPGGVLARRKYAFYRLVIDLAERIANENQRSG